MIERVHDGVHYLTFESFDGVDGVSAVVTTRRGGASTGPYATMNLGRRTADAAEAVALNRARAAALVNAPVRHLTFGKQVHRANVAVVTAVDAGIAFDDTDALVTRVTDTPLVILTADCAAVLLVDPKQRAVGIAHAGWRGTVARIGAATVTAMRDAFGSLPTDLLAAVGPSIGPCCYEVGGEVIDAVGAAFPDHAEELLIEPDMASAGSFRAAVNEDRKHFDLWRANERVLLDAGVAENHIEIGGMCTACRTDLFYSHRAEQGLTGRFGALVMLHGSTSRIY
ncbi:MAG TPA: peptidoglycan editing factor PgeF [Candidatus Krumholzibacteria bacterium]|nr:peptidoglycan editing factor PgeF [Candidatus Krumholzibacteria bacterium]